MTAADITHDSDVEILNPDQTIATLGKNGHLRMRMYAVRGRGYVPADRNKRDDLAIGVIPVDSFTHLFLALTSKWKILVLVN